MITSTLEIQVQDGDGIRVRAFNRDDASRWVAVIVENVAADDACTYLEAVMSRGFAVGLRDALTQALA